MAIVCNSRGKQNALDLTQRAGSGGCRACPGSLCGLANDLAQVAKARAHAFLRRHGADTEFDVLLHHAPARIAVPCGIAEEGGKIDAALADLREYAGFDRLIEVEPF